MNAVAAAPSVPPVLADAVILIAFFIFIVIYGNRGFYGCLAPLIVTVLSAGGAMLLSGLLAGRVAEQLYPWVQEQVASRMDLSAIRNLNLRDITSQMSRLMPESAASLLRKLDIDLYPFVEQAFNAASPEDTARHIAEDALGAMMLPITRYLVRIALFFIFFLMFKLLLTLAKDIMGLAFEVRGLSFLNTLGGAVIGAAWCAVWLYVVCWIVDLAFPEFFAGLRSGSRILSLVLRT